MSVINKMLQELDKRQGTQDEGAPLSPASAGTSGFAKLTQQVRPVRPAAFGSNLFWRVMAGLMVVVIAWVIWVMWQIMPRSVLTDRAHQLTGQGRLALPPVLAPLPAASQPDTAAAPPSSAAPPAPASASAAAPPPPSKAASETVRDSDRIDMLRLATEIVTPIKTRNAKTAQAARSTDRQTIDRQTIAATKPGALAATRADRRVEPARSAPRAPATRAAAAAPDVGRIDKRVDVTPRERAESEFRRAMDLVNQGRMAEGMERLYITLALDSSFELARQTLVALLLEAKRTDEAGGLLQDALAADPANVGYGMVLARIHVQRGDPRGALALLQKFEAAARTNADYHGFVAALLQRLGRHIEAVAQYQGALRLTGEVGTWWVGLGISQEALAREQDAIESFRRAKGTGNLSAELLAFVDRRLKQLQ